LPLIPREKGELDLRELLLIAAGTLLGSCLGVTMMCLFQINKDCRVKRKRNIQKIVRFNRKEAQDLAAKAKKACLSEAGLIRLLIRGYEPKEKPDDRFYDVMRELSSIGNNINQLAAKANTLGFIDAPMLKNEAAKWNKFQSEIERTYLRPNQSEMKWQ
jgi:hypothetical protein